MHFVAGQGFRTSLLFCDIQNCNGVVAVCSAKPFSAVKFSFYRSFICCNEDLALRMICRGRDSLAFPLVAVWLCLPQASRTPHQIAIRLHRVQRKKFSRRKKNWVPEAAFVFSPSLWLQCRRIGTKWRWETLEIKPLVRPRCTEKHNIKMGPR